MTHDLQTSGHSNDERDRPKTDPSTLGREAHQQHEAKSECEIHRNDLTSGGSWQTWQHLVMNEIGGESAEQFWNKRVPKSNHSPVCGRDSDDHRFSQAISRIIAVQERKNCEREKRCQPKSNRVRPTECELCLRRIGLLCGFEFLWSNWMPLRPFLS